MAGNAVINQVNTLSGLLKPVIGGIMFGMWGIYPILILSIGCFSFSAVMEIFIHIPHEKRIKEESGIFSSYRKRLKGKLPVRKTEKPVFLFCRVSDFYFQSDIKFGYDCRNTYFDYTGT